MSHTIFFQFVSLQRNMVTHYKSLPWYPWVIFQIATEIGVFFHGAKQIHGAARSYHPVHRRLLYRSLGIGPRGHRSSQKGGKCGWSQNSSQAFQLQPLGSEVICHVFSVSTRFNVSLMLNTQNLKSYDEPSRPEQWCLPSWDCHLEMEFLLSPRIKPELEVILYPPHPWAACPQQGMPQSLRSLHHVSEKQKDIVIQRLGWNPSSDMDSLCGFGLQFPHGSDENNKSASLRVVAKIEWGHSCKGPSYCSQEHPACEKYNSYLCPNMRTVQSQTC